MSTQGASTSSPSSSSTPRWTYDVFLSFREQDTDASFPGRLYMALHEKDIETFWDCETLEGGKFISQELVKAIGESRFAIIIFSKNYAFSTRCLDKLVHINRCRKEKRLEVLPIFYRVDPSEVWKQKGTLAKAFDKYKERFKESIEKVEIWRSTLEEVANLPGWNLQNRDEAEVIQHIIEELMKKLMKKLSSKFSRINKNLIGIESIMEELIPSYLDFGNNVCMIGICGMGGMGKTTLARVVYDMYSDQFQVSSFIADVREKSEKGGLLKLQKQFLEESLGKINKEIGDVQEGVDIIKNGLCHKKVLLVLDDVNDVNQLKNLVGGHDWFGLGSWIIITTRDERVFVKQGVLKIYKLNELKNNDAFKLFCLKAFKNEQPKEGYTQLSQEVVKYASGLPLALVTLGSFLLERKRDEWQSALDYFEKNHKKKIFDILKISFDGLEEMWQEIFLDIACFFKGWPKSEVIPILENCGFNARIGMSVLLDKSLLTVTGYDEILGMHDLLQDMGKKIVRQQSCGELGRQSRLWLFENLLHVLENNTATSAIQAIVIKNWKAGCNFGEFPEVFSEMSNLRLLIIDELCIPNALNRVPNGLRHLSCKSCSLKCLPSSFEPKELVGLDLQYSECKYLWEGAKCLGNLKSINLSSSMNLIRTPDFSGVPSLEFLDLAQCSNLVGLHPSIGQLSKLEALDLSQCKKLRSASELPSTIRYINMESCCSLEPSPALLRQSSLSRANSSLFFRGYDESGGGVAFTILNRYLQGLFCQKTGYEAATKRKEDGSKTEFQIIIPGCLVPRWLTHQSWGNSISVLLPPNWCNSRWMGFTLCAFFNMNMIYYTSFRAHVKAIGDMPHRQYVSQLFFRKCRQYNVWLLYLSRDDWFSAVGSGECSQIEVVFKGDSVLRYLSSTNLVVQCGVSLVYEQDREPMEELNQANAQCSSSSRVITFEGWDGVHHGIFNSERSHDEFDDLAFKK